jgi:4a-hydroxytetrahydrobiopterin dehydratase
MQEALSPDAIAAAMATLPGWRRTPDRPAIQRSFQFKDFTTAWGFMSQCALHAEKVGHHPEWFNVWATVDVTLTTHDVGGLSTLDIDFAQFMSQTAHALQD